MSADLIGKVFRKGGPQPGFWIVIGISPGSACILLGIDKLGNITAGSHYQSHYVERKQEISRVDVSQLCFIDTGQCVFPREIENE